MHLRIHGIGHEQAWFSGERSGKDKAPATELAANGASLGIKEDASSPGGPRPCGRRRCWEGSLPGRPDASDPNTRTGMKNTISEDSSGQRQ